MNTSLRIVQTSVLNPWDERHGGGQLSTHDLATALSGRGHEVTVVYTGTPAEVPGDVAYRPVFLPHRERLYLNPVHIARVVAQRFRGVDVVHSQGYEGAFLGNAVGPDVRVFATSRHPDPPDLTGSPPSTRPLQRMAWTRRNVIALLARRALARADTAILVSEHSRRVLTERGYLTSTSDAAVAHNGGRGIGAAGSETASVANPTATGPKNLVCIARLDHHKGLDTLIRAVAAMEQKARVDLVGSGWEESALKSLAAQLEVEDRIHFLGYRDPAEVAVLRANAGVVVLPSRSENFPRVILEAMHAGRPIVASNVGGIPEAVRHEQEALLVDPDDPTQLARALDRMLTDDRLRTTLAHNAANRAAEFTWERTAEKVEAIYRAAERRG